MKENNQKTYWKGLEELNQDPEFLKRAQNEFPEYLPIDDAYGKQNSSGTETGRRDFLKLLGFGVAAVSLAACEAPVKKAIPYLNKPEEIEPGVANWYASTYMDGSDYVSILVKTREGRPIKIEGNDLSSITRGGTSARAQASLLGLYDEARFKFFQVKGKDAKQEDYAKIDQDIMQRLSQADSKGIRIISPTIFSPSTKKAIEEFKSKYPSTQHIMYDAVSAYGIIKANRESFGKAIVPTYNFQNAEVIVGFNCDFLGTWISPVEFAKQWVKRRKVNQSNKTMSRHYQFETNLSITGASADFREPIKPADEGAYLATLYNIITGSSVNAPEVKSKWLQQAAQDLKNARGKSLVVSGSNNKNIQILVNEINNALTNYGSTININRACNLKQGNDEELVKFIDDAKNGRVGAVIFYNANPVHNFALGKELQDNLKNIDLTISFARKGEETSKACEYVIPDYHYLESWNDAEPYAGVYSMVQPTITPIFRGTRAAQQSLLTWAGNTKDYFTFIQDNWKSSILRGGNFQKNWDKVVHDGVYEPAVKNKSGEYAAFAMETQLTPDTLQTSAQLPETDTLARAPKEDIEIPGAIQAKGSRISSNSNVSDAVQGINELSKSLSGLQLKLYEKVAIGDGSHADNPWLQETPDPISKITWDNYVSVPLSLAKDENNPLIKGDVVKVTLANGKSITLPVVEQPGQAAGTISIALGYGRAIGMDNETVGQNPSSLIQYNGESFDYVAGGVKIEKTGAVHHLATTQTHQTVMGRETILKEDTLTAFQQADWQRPYQPKIHTSKGEVAPGGEGTDLWYQHDKPNHLWTMIIDLNSCIGCSACVVSCQVENNVPVVGKQEVINAREMHWLRIDRYYSSAYTKEMAKEDGTGVLSMYGKMEDPAENPEITFQPMLCQHCNHAPCETVCPVAATIHSSEGMNMMAYNRCVGTRYCANNCPYKVRRFNWFKYFNNDKFDMNTPMNTMLGRMVLNPDVTVRSRGVMEKCSFCVQRIQEGKLAAKKEKRQVRDGEVRTACATACPTNAIMFGDINDTESYVHKELNAQNTKRAYTVLEELNTRPNVAYLTKIKNKNA